MGLAVANNLVDINVHTAIVCPKRTHDSTVDIHLIDRPCLTSCSSYEIEMNQQVSRSQKRIRTMLQLGGFRLPSQQQPHYLRFVRHDQGQDPV